MMYLGDLIGQIRKDSNNRSETITPSSTEGIEDIDFVISANRAQERLQSLIVGRNDQAFSKTDFISTVSGQAEYSIFDDAYLKNKLQSVEYSATGILEDYYQLVQKTFKERNNLSTLYLEGYLLQAGKIVLDPKPTTSVTNGLRVTYVRRLPSLDLRRSTVVAVTLNSGTSQITNLQLDVVNSPALTGDNLTIFQQNNYFSVVDKYGTIKMARIPYSAINTADGTITVPASFTYKSGETISVGDYVVCGYIATSHSQLPDECERYLQLFVTRYIFKRDSTNDAEEADRELKELEDDLLANFSDLNDDVDYVTVLDDSFLF